MNTKEIAQALDGSLYGFNVPYDVRKEAAKNKIVIAYGDSDDLLELDGYVYDEIDACEGVKVRFNMHGLVKNECEMGDGCANWFTPGDSTSVEMSLNWIDEKGSPAWTINFPVPHETFNIIEDGEVFSVGIVFSMADVKKHIYGVDVK